MKIVRLTKEFDFEAAHALDGYGGKCKDIHGHSYHFRITTIGKPIENTANPTCGMVIDFADLKQIVKEHILSKFDHYLILRNDSRFRGLEASNPRIRYVDYQPTCENMLLEMVEILKDKLPKGIQLHSALLRETATSYAEWFTADNE